MGIWRLVNIKFHDCLLVFKYQMFTVIGIPFCQSFNPKFPLQADIKATPDFSDSRALSDIEILTRD